MFGPLPLPLACLHAQGFGVLDDSLSVMHLLKHRIHKNKQQVFVVYGKIGSEFWFSLGVSKACVDLDVWWEVYIPL